jgi:SAM-dependent methyltransferase
MERLEHCRACLAARPYLFLPLGDHPPANMFVRPAELEETQPTFSLNTQACLHCGLIQVVDQIPADFFRHHHFVPSGATPMHRHFDDLADMLKQHAGDALIVDIGCKDGLLLKACNDLGCETLGVDPNANLAELALERGVEVHVAYFDPETAGNLRRDRGPAKVIVTTNTFTHIGDLHHFMMGVVRLLDEDGTFVVEVPWAKALLARNEFDTVYQEHVSAFSLLSMVKLGRFFGLEVVDVHRLPIKGHSMRVFLRRASKVIATPAVEEMLGEELAGGMLDASTYDDFADRIESVRSDLIDMLRELKQQGLKIAGYGAPAKGNTQLNYFGVGPDDLDFLVDRNPLKQGLYSPGMKIPILSPEAIETERPDILMVLAWNFLEEIREQQTAFTSRGGRFLVPLPRPVLMS